MRSLGAHKFFAKQAIDIKAGEVRLRFITDVPGQQAVYLVKLEQARALLADQQMDPPPYIAAEAAATGQAPIDVAQAVVSLAELWNHQIGPAIEGARLGGKAVVDAAETPEAVASARDAALAALEAIGME